MKVVFSEEEILIDTYPEAACEELPMFAENRVHQRTSGNPYPNKIVGESQRKVREKRPYTLLKLENEFIEVGILPAIGGKVWYAKDKKNGYDFFYKNNVVKPALIGVLGSWTSGGLEFNWPFHHRASSFMPVDYAVEEEEDGVTVWLSEHDPIDRMKGMVGICLREGQTVLETKVKLDNLTAVRRPYLWWENAAVPVDETYEIFFPEDVNYVRFHYKRSVTTYPVANNDRFGAYNGLLFNGDTDISKHKNTKQATSYFSAASKYDFFGGYDHGKDAGVVHIADAHIAPGKKLFTWAYSQLAKTWENALTDKDGQYAELMAGTYSDNQPDFNWIQPGETKTFSQKWFPIHGQGKPTFANDNGAMFWNGDKVSVQCVKAVKGAIVRAMKDGKILEEKTMDLPAYDDTVVLTSLERAAGVTVSVMDGKRKVFVYEATEKAETPIPEPRKELPYFKQVKTAQELYLEGLHVEQYRSPEFSAEACYLESLERDGEFIPSLCSLAEIYLARLQPQKALEYIDRAEKSATRFNTRTESGRVYYLKGLVLEQLKDYEQAYAYYYKAFWLYDSATAAMFRIGLLDLRNADYEKAIEHFGRALQGNGKSPLAKAFLGLTYYLYDKTAEAEKVLDEALAGDKLNMFAHAFKALMSGDYAALASLMHSDATQTTSDIVEKLLTAGLDSQALALIDGLSEHIRFNAMIKYTRGVLANDIKSVDVGEGIAFPSRPYEEDVLRATLNVLPNDCQARYLLGCMLYGKGRYEEGAKEFEEVARQSGDYRAYRNLAAAYYSHLGNVKKALACMKTAAEKAPVSERQITFERAHLMAKTGSSPKEIAKFILSRDTDRDDINVELARAYNHAGDPDKALNVLMNREFVACEGGEHYIADEYMYAYYLKGAAAYKKGDYKKALEYFETAQVLPQSLGSGLWNEVKTVPYRYFAALCHIKLGEKEKAEAILKDFDKYYFDFFSDMYLYTLAYYVAKSYELLGDKAKGVALIEKRLQEFENAREVEDMGYFGTTPFFISFIEQPAAARKAHYAYPLYMFSSFLGDKKRMKKYAAELDADKYGLFIEDIQ